MSAVSATAKPPSGWPGRPALLVVPEEPVAALRFLGRGEALEALDCRTERGATHQTAKPPAPSPISIPPEALMRVRFVRPGNMAQAVTGQLQPVASELVAALRGAAAAERGRSRTGERS
jgi:hypothetical protein